MAGAASPFEMADVGLFREAAAAIDNAREVSRELRVLRARLENHVGSAVRAIELARRLLNERLTHREKASCWEVIARVSLATGAIEDGLRAFSKANLEAQATEDATFESRVLASYIQSMVGWVGLEPAMVEMSRLRQHAIRSGDGRAMVDFHLLSAEIATKRGQLLTASENLATARGLLGTFWSINRAARLEIIETATGIVQADYEKALSHARTSVLHSRQTGSRELLIPSLNNLAYIRLAQGDYVEVSTLLDELLTIITRGGPAEIGILDTEMMLALATGDLARAGSLADAILACCTNFRGRANYYFAWHLPTRVKWMYRLGDYLQGISLATDGLSKLEQGSDDGLLARLYLLISEGHHHLGTSAAKTFFAKAVEACSEPSLELLAEMHRVTALFLSKTSAEQSREHFAIAARILSRCGNISARNELIQSEKAIFGVKADRAQEPNEPNLAAAVPDRLSAMLELGSSVMALADEIMSLLEDTRTASAAALIAIAYDGGEETVKSFSEVGAELGVAHQTIKLGAYKDRQYEIRLTPGQGPDALTMITNVQRIASAAAALCASRRQRREQPTFLSKPEAQRAFGMICASDQTLALIETIRRVATSSVTILLTGETGVGKELFARAIHQASARRERAFIPFNVTAVPRDMLDSQLFGHKRGSFTGAINDAPGVIKAAAGGTLFLDEIGEMSLEAQPKLLRFLESSEILPLGQHTPETVDVRLIAATNANLDQLMNDGKFREDLYYRLNVIRIDIPPLRERREEIPPLVDHFLERFSRELQKPMPRVADETLEYLVLYRWPGNVRQLSNEMRRMVALAEPGAVLMPAHLSAEIAASRRTIPTEKVPASSIEVLTRIDQPLAAAVEHVERATIQRAMAVCENRVDEAAKLLGLSRKGLYLKRQRLKIEDADLRRS